MERIPNETRVQFWTFWWKIQRIFNEKNKKENLIKMAIEAKLFFKWCKCRRGSNGREKLLKNCNNRSKFRVKWKVHHYDNKKIFSNICVICVRGKIRFNVLHMMSNVAWPNMKNLLRFLTVTLQCLFKGIGKEKF